MPFRSMQDADAKLLPPFEELSGSLSDRVYQAVKSAIMSLNFPPSSVIRKSAICEFYSLPRSPVSDASAKLSAESLVDILPQSGTRVARLTMTAIREGAFMREALEVAAARHAARNRSEATLAPLARSVEFQRLSIADMDKEDFHRTDEEFHEIIIATTQVARLPASVRSVSRHVDKGRALLIPKPGRLAETLSEHTSSCRHPRPRRNPYAKRNAASFGTVDRTTGSIGGRKTGFVCHLRA